MLDIPPRRALIIGLLVLGPVAVFGVDRNEPIAGLVAVSVIIILISLYVSFRPPEPTATPSG